MIRVERLDGTLLHVGHRDRVQGRFLVSALPGGARSPSSPPPGLEPVWDGEGLVLRRPGGFWHEDPSYRTYTLAAMLDPVELADGHDESGPAGTPPVTIDELAQVDHHGRATWEAVVRPTPAYDPRCSCCPLLAAATTLLLTGPSTREEPDDWQYGGQPFQAWVYWEVLWQDRATGQWGERETRWTRDGVYVTQPFMNMGGDGPGYWQSEGSRLLTDGRAPSGPCIVGTGRPS